MPKTRQGFNYAKLVTNGVGAAGVLAFTGKATIKRLVISKPPTAAGLVNIYDGTDNSGTLITAMHLDTRANGQAIPDSVELDINVDTGLYLQGDGTVSGAEVVAVWISE